MKLLPSFARRVVDRASGALHKARLARLDADERRALLRLMYDVAATDGVLAADELSLMQDLAARLDVPWTEIDDISLKTAVGKLAANDRVLRLACLVVADAFFVDGDYDASEKEFVASFQQRFSLGENPLKDAVESLRKKKLDEALAEWDAQIAAKG